MLCYVEHSHGFLGGGGGLHSYQGLDECETELKKSCASPHGLLGLCPILHMVELTNLYGAKGGKGVISIPIGWHEKIYQHV